MIFKINFKPAKTKTQFLLLAIFGFPFMVAVNVTCFAVAIWFTWHGVTTYCPQVRMITWLQAFEFAVGLLVLTMILGNLFKKSD
jgi:hypothetical protein